jgi:hypothetical protein
MILDRIDPNHERDRFQYFEKRMRAENRYTLLIPLEPYPFD